MSMMNDKLLNYIDFIMMNGKVNEIRISHNTHFKILELVTNLALFSGLLDCILDCIYFYHDVGMKCHRVKHKVPYALTYTPLCVEVCTFLCISIHFYTFLYISIHFKDTPPQVIRAALQLTCNLCVGNHPVQGAVWARLYPTMFGTLLDNIDKNVKNYVCSILFYCTAWKGSSALEVECEL